MEKQSLMEIDGKPVEARTIRKIKNLIQIQESKGREAASKRAENDYVPRIQIEHTSEFNYEANQVFIDDYNKEHNLGKYWKGIPKKISNHYLREEIHEQTKHFPVFSTVNIN